MEYLEGFGRLLLEEFMCLFSFCLPGLDRFHAIRRGSQVLGQIMGGMGSSLILK